MASGGAAGGAPGTQPLAIKAASAIERAGTRRATQSVDRENTRTSVEVKRQSPVKSRDTTRGRATQQVVVSRVAIVGAGIFGATAALALRRRGHDVALFDPGPLPHPLAESTDVSKVVRLDYGPDDDYLAWMESALEGWRRWNAAWQEELFHEDGVLFLTRAPMTPGGFEHESFVRLLGRGHPVERLDAGAIRTRFPAWSTGAYIDGYFNPAGGWAESARVVERVLRDATAAGVSLYERHTFERLAENGSRASGIVTREGNLFAADRVVVAAGSWTPQVLPFLAQCLCSVGQPVFQLAPAYPAPYEAPRFPVFGADIARTGYYGFPLTRDGRVKIANHGVGRVMHPEARERAVTPEDEAALRAFLRETFPGLAGASIVQTRVCVYSDTWDGHFWIAPDPHREGLVVAAGGSGHAFKFAPVLGDWVADAVEGAPNPSLGKFRWRPEVRPVRTEEAARHQG
jgi:glycine/D-amino acid oxidase-like deaminating enzyme